MYFSDTNDEFLARSRSGGDIKRHLLVRRLSRGHRQHPVYDGHDQSERRQILRSRSREMNLFTLFNVPMSHAVASLRLEKILHHNLQITLELSVRVKKIFYH